MGRNLASRKGNSISRDWEGIWKRGRGTGSRRMASDFRGKDPDSAGRNSRKIKIAMAEG